MYVYPNGLTCNVSRARVNAYERTVPPIAAVLMLIGIVFIMKWFCASLGLFLIGMTLATVWSFVCMVAAFVVFDFWCKPVN